MFRGVGTGSRDSPWGGSRRRQGFHLAGSQSMEGSTLHSELVSLPISMMFLSSDESIGNIGGGGVARDVLDRKEIRASSSHSFANNVPQVTMLFPWARAASQQFVEARSHSIIVS